MWYYISIGMLPFSGLVPVCVAPFVKIRVLRLWASQLPSSLPTACRPVSDQLIPRGGGGAARLYIALKLYMLLRSAAKQALNTGLRFYQKKGGRSWQKQERGRVFDKKYKCHRGEVANGTSLDLFMDSICMVQSQMGIITLKSSGESDKH